MEYYIYVLRSQADGSYYKGFTLNPLIRLQRHNDGESAYTRKKLPWVMIYLEIFQQKSDALIREKALKKYSHPQIEQLITSSKNQLKQYLER